MAQQGLDYRNGVGIVVADAQIPYHDQRALDAVMTYISDVKPDWLINLGDWLDLPYLTTKFLRKSAPPDSLLKDLAIAREHHEYFVRYSKEVKYIAGNHEERLLRYILERAPDLEGLTETGSPLSIPALLDVPGVDYIGPYGEAFELNSVIFKHGDTASKYAAATELRDEGSSGMSGHCHRFQVASNTTRSGAHAWYSVPCLCYVKGPKMPPGYREGKSRLRNQQQGFATVHFDSGIFNAYVTIITDGRFIAPNGNKYGSQKGF